MLYADYILEREGFSSIEKEEGFITFKMESPEVCYIRDVYIKPEFRKMHVARDFHLDVMGWAKLQGAKFLAGSVAEGDKEASRNISAMLSAGFKFSYFNDRLRLLIFKKEVI